MTINTGYRHKDYPVMVNGVFAQRVQDVGLNKNTPITAYFELGNEQTVGSMVDTARYPGSIRWFPINNQIECLFAGYTTSGCTVNLAQLITTGPGVPIKTLKQTMGLTKLTSIEYSCRADGEFTGTMNYEGAERGAGGAIVATTPTGVPCYKSKDMSITVGATPGLRVTGFDVRITIPSERLVELNNADPVATVQDPATVTANIDFVESDAMTANTELDIAAPADIIITAGTSAVYRLTLKKMISGPDVRNDHGAVRAWATRRYSYQTGAYDASGGAIWDKV